MRLARLKLTGTKNTEDDLCKSYHALAILSQRLGLRVTLGHQEGTPFLDDSMTNLINKYKWDLVGQGLVSRVGNIRYYTYKYSMTVNSYRIWGIH